MTNLEEWTFPRFLKTWNSAADKLDLKNAVYGIDNLLVDGIKAKVLMKESQKVKNAEVNNYITSDFRS